MIPKYVCLVSEDDVSEAVLHRLVGVHARELSVYSSRTTGGFGQMQKNILAFNNAAKGLPYIVLADLDNHECVPALVADWFGPHTQHPDLCFRVAVREVEAWLLADRDGMSDFLGVQVNLVPQNPDSIADPKAALIAVARRCRVRKVREAIVPLGTAQVGPDYNGEVGRFVRDCWNIERACINSVSLQKAQRRIAELVSS